MTFTYIRAVSVSISISNFGYEFFLPSHICIHISINDLGMDHGYGKFYIQFVCMLYCITRTRNLAFLNSALEWSWATSIRCDVDGSTFKLQDSFQLKIHTAEYDLQHKLPRNIYCGDCLMHE